MMRVLSRTILGWLVVITGWLVIFGGVSLSCARLFGPVSMVEAWSDSAAWWMFPVSAFGIAVGATLIWLGNRLADKDNPHHT